MKPYIPHPAETGKIELGAELNSLVEAMAENVHEMWARTRMQQGWTRGPKRDDDRKQHPCLVPYAELPDSEKVYDRNSAVETLKLIQKLGFQIVPAKEKMTSQDELRHYKSAMKKLAEGENFKAYDLAETLTSPQYKLHVQGLALARSGSLRRAGECAAQLRDYHDPECAGFRSRIYKDLGVAAANPEEKTRHFLHAAEISLRVFEAEHAYYNGVNAASCFLLAGQTERARQIARETIRIAEADHDLWAVATLGECALILGHREEARKHYRQASKMAHGRYGDFSSTVRQLKLLLNHLDGNADALTEYVELPCIALFRASRAAAFDENGMRPKIDDWLKRHHPALAYLSCDTPESVLFAEIMLAEQIDCFILLNLPREENTRKYFARHPHWLARMNAVLDHPMTTLIPAECQSIGEKDQIIDDFSEKYLAGLTKLKSQSLFFQIKRVHF